MLAVVILPSVFQCHNHFLFHSRLIETFMIMAEQVRSQRFGKVSGYVIHADLGNTNVCSDRDISSSLTLDHC